MSQLWVVSQDWGYEGLGEPLAVFMREDHAQKFVELASGNRVLVIHPTKVWWFTEAYPKPPEETDPLNIGNDK